MRKRFLSAASLLLPLLMHAQVTINVQLPPGGLVQKDNLWNIILVNNTPSPVDVNLKMSLQDAATGQVMLSANSGMMPMGKGVKLLNWKDVQPITYNFTNPDFARSFLPMGRYIVCYQVYQNNNGKEQPLGEECVHVNIDPLSPPLLNSPADRSAVYDPYPQFTWMPPTPFDMFTSLSYDLIICEIKEGQKPVEAIQYNTPVYIRSNIEKPYESYSSAYTRLEEGKSYAWQIAAINGSNYAAKTDVWSFTVQKDSVKKIISDAPYVRLDKATSVTAVAQQGFLKMVFNNRTIDSTAEFVVRNLSSGQKAGNPVLFRFKMPLMRGENFLLYDMSKHGKLNKENVYQVEYINSLHESYFMKFLPVYYR